MTPDAASTQPRKRRWKRLIVALACVVAVVAIVLLANAPKPEPVKVWFVRATNELGVKKLVFQGTNGTPEEIYFFASVSIGALRPAMTPGGVGPAIFSADLTIAAGTNFNFTVDVPSNGVPYVVAWNFFGKQVPLTHGRRFQVGCYSFLMRRGMPRLAQHFEVGPQVHYIPSSEIKE